MDSIHTNTRARATQQTETYLFLDPQSLVRGEEKGAVETESDQPKGQSEGVDGTPGEVRVKWSASPVLHYGEFMIRRGPGTLTLVSTYWERCYIPTNEGVGGIQRGGDARGLPAGFARG